MLAKLELVLVTVLSKLIMAVIMFITIVLVLVTVDVTLVKLVLVHKMIVCLGALHGLAGACKAHGGGRHARSSAPHACVERNAAPSC